MYKPNTVKIFKETRTTIKSIVDPELVYPSVWAMSDWIREHGFDITNCFDGWRNNDGDRAGMIVVQTEYGLVYVYVKHVIHDAWVLDHVE